MKELSFAFMQTDQTYRDDCMCAEARAEIAEEELAVLKAEVLTAHRVLDGYVSRSTDYKRHGQRLMALSERIDALVEKITKSESDGWEKYSQQIRANTALVADIEALRRSLDRIEVENLRLSSVK